MRRKIVDRPWVFVRQVHGSGVVVVERTRRDLEPADALVSRSNDLALAVLGADCALVGMSSEEGVIGAAHAGWRGVMAGVLEATADEMRRLGATTIEAVVSACVHADCYPFSPNDLDAAALILGDEVRGSSANGRPAFDLPVAVRAGLSRAGVEIVRDVDRCTACDDSWYSNRARSERERQALVIWRD